MRILGVTASSILKIPPSSYESIASATASGGETSITLSSIPQTYVSLQLRCMLRRNNVNRANMGLRPNNQTSSSFYTQHTFYGNGSSVIVNSAASGTYNYAINTIEIPGNATAYGAQIWDIHNYASTTQNKTLRTFAGFDINGTGHVGLSSNLFIKTDAITSLVIFFGGDAIDAGSTFALYGIKG